MSVISSTTARYYLDVTTDFRPGGTIMRKARAGIYDFQAGVLQPDTRSWPGGFTPSPADCREDLSEVVRKFDEVLLHGMDWEPLSYLQGSQEYLNHVAVIKIDANGDESIERLWVADEASFYVIAGALVKPGAPRFQEWSYDRLFYEIFLENEDEFNFMQEVANENAPRMLRFPEEGFLVDELTELCLDPQDLDEDVQSFGACVALILENHVGMAIKMIADENTWFFRLQVAPESFSQVNRCNNTSVAAPSAELTEAQMREHDDSCKQFVPVRRYFFDAFCLTQ